MHITKIGHCCLVVEHKGKTIMTDPGSYSIGQDMVTGIDLILITHEHPDHLHIDSLKKVLINNPNAEIITNSSVGKILDEQNIEYTVLEDGQNLVWQEILFEGYGTKHEEIYGELGQVLNTGYFIDNKLFYPGDAFTNPNKPVDILAAPISAPWGTFKQCLNYIKEIAPRIAFPVHDGMLINGRTGPIYRLPPIILENTNIKFVELKEGKSLEE
jgi:L-ascorbate metabolism protein UlaG (beta-lactamase superfamily)